MKTQASPTHSAWELVLTSLFTAVILLMAFTRWDSSTCPSSRPRSCMCR